MFFCPAKRVARMEEKKVVFPQGQKKTNNNSRSGERRLSNENVVGEGREDLGLGH